eukprot:scaffold80726_cov23-Tisochrysis_lutea.AAC.1
MDGAHCCHAGITCSSNKLYEACRPDLENQTLYAFPGARPACGHLASQQLAQPTKAMMSVTQIAPHAPFCRGHLGRGFPT